MTPQRRAPRRRSRGTPGIAFALATAAAGIVAFLALGTALAMWTTSGSGTGSGSTATLEPVGDLIAASTADTVHLSWTPATTPDDLPVSGLVVTRHAGAASSPACGTVVDEPGSHLPHGTTTCVDTDVDNGTYTYTVTAVFRTWSVVSSASNALTVDDDGTGPSMTLALAPGASGASLSGTTLWYQGDAPGGFRLVATVTDSVSGPRSAHFPALGVAGWTHDAETVTVGTGSSTSRAYTSSPYAWTAAPVVPPPTFVVGSDAADNTTTIPLTFTRDDAGPTGGALTVNSVAATGPSSTSYNRTGSVTIGSRVNYSGDAGSGLASSVLTRSDSALSGGSCGTFGTATVLTGTPNQNGLGTGCYRYALTGTDRVGNMSVLTTTVRVDRTAPTQVLGMEPGTGRHFRDNRVYFRHASPGSFVLTSTVSDGESGAASTTYPAAATSGWTHDAETVLTPAGSGASATTTSSPWTWTANPGTPGARAIVSADAAGSTVSTSLAFAKDSTAPNGGSLRVNGTAASAAGTTSSSRTGSFSIERTDFVEPPTTNAAGLDRSVLTREKGILADGACSDFEAAVELTGAPAQSDLGVGCYRYTLTATDLVGNEVVRAVIVRVDLTGPTGGSVTVAGGTASLAGDVVTNVTGSWNVEAVTPWVDAQSGMGTSVLVRTTATMNAAGVCGSFGSTTTISTATVPLAQTGTNRRCYRYTFTGTNAVALASPPVVVTVRVAPEIASLSLINGGGTAGRADQGDRIVISYAQQMDPSSFCSAWGASGDQQLVGDSQVTVSLSNGSADTITATSTACTFNLGTIALGSNAYTTSTVRFAGSGANRSTVTWNHASRTLTITLGAASGSAAAAVTNSVVTYTPSTTQRNPAGLTMGGTFATGDVRQF